MFRRVVIGSGPTVEPIDPVRYISNRSSGKSGFQLAYEAVNREYEEIIFVSGPSCYRPEGVTYVPVETALEMQEQLRNYAVEAEVIIMAAAVSDYRVADYSTQKIKKNHETLTLDLVKNPDILCGLGQVKPEGQVLVGYAAETDNIFDNARKKYERKNLDLLILNQISEDNPAFNTDDNQVWFLTPDGFRELQKMEKSTLAAHIWDEIEKQKKISHGLHG